MKLFINLSNLVQGGSLQVANSFLSEINKLTSENKYLVVSNKNFYIDNSLFDNKFIFKTVESSPSKFTNRFNIVLTSNKELLNNDSFSFSTRDER